MIILRKENLFISIAVVMLIFSGDLSARTKKRDIPEVPTGLSEREFLVNALIKRQIEVPGTFDQNGWLTIGVAGHQAMAGEGYISTGSLYLCTTGLLMLGLPATDPFWQGEDEKWTSRKAWEGEYFPIDHAL